MKLVFLSLALMYLSTCTDFVIQFLDNQFHLEPGSGTGFQMKLTAKLTAFGNETGFSFAGNPAEGSSKTSFVLSRNVCLELALAIFLGGRAFGNETDSKTQPDRKQN